LMFEVRGFNPLQHAVQGEGEADLVALAREVSKRARGSFTVESVNPVDGQADAPGSTFVVVIRDNNPLAFLGNSEKTAKDIRERFGELDDVRLAQVESVEVERGVYVVHAKLTAEGRKMWLHSFGLFWGTLPLIEQGVPLGMMLYNIQNMLLNW